MKKNNNIVVTGGSGFIGSHFIKYLLQVENKLNIFNIDLLTYAGDNRRLKEIEDDPRYHFIKCDIRDKQEIIQHLKNIKPDTIFHFASETHVDNSIEKPDDFITTNIYGTFNILEYIRANNTRLIHISTDEIYGDRRKNNPLFSEVNSYKPSSPYSATKASQEMLTNSYIRTYGIKATIIRPCNNFGPFQHTEKFIPKCIVNALTNKPIPVYGSGSNIREWIYVNDCCEAIYTIFKRGKDGEKYNIGSGILISNLNMVKKILKLTSRSEKLIRFVPDRPGHDRLYGVNYNKLKRLGFKPRITLSEGLKITISWYKNYLNLT